MDIIMLDLEATMYSRDIIEIGAVRLAKGKKGYRITDSFQTYVRPTPLSKLDAQTTKFTGITRDDVVRSPNFHKAIELFAAWLGDGDYYFCTWSESDLILLKKACRHYFRKAEWIRNYNDLQAIYARKYFDENRQISLKDALEEAGIDVTGRLHGALTDAEHTGKLFLTKFTENDLLKSASLDEALNHMDTIKFGYPKRQEERSKMEDSKYRKRIYAIKSKRKQLKMSIEDLSTTAGVSSSRLKKIEEFERPATNFEISKLFKALQAPGARQQVK